MKLDKIQPQPQTLLEFFEEGLPALGAVTERSWHDRLETVAEGPAAQLWNPQGELVSTELEFPNAASLRDVDASRQVFPGCPLTFHLAEILRAQRPSEFRVISSEGLSSKPLTSEVLNNTWSQQMRAAGHVTFGPLLAEWHFTFVLLVRCEIQSTGQHWSLHRVAVSWPGGERDPLMERDFGLLIPAAAPAESVPWPHWNAEVLEALTRAAMEEEIQTEIAPIRERQQQYLQRELARIDTYFASYEAELKQRASRRSASADAHTRHEDRLRAAQEEHQRRREDQIHRHEISVIPTVDLCVCVAERAWATRVTVRHGRESQEHPYLYVPRLRRWFPRSVAPVEGEGK
jgi:hypothetical protein